MGMQAIATLQALQATFGSVQQVAAALPTQVDTLRRDLTLEARATRKETLRQVDLLRRDVTAITDRTERDAAIILDSRTAEVLAVLDARTAAMLAKVDPLLARVDAIAAHAQETSELLLVCDQNPQCFANRSIGTMQAVERFAQAAEHAARTVDAAMPVVVADAEAVTAASVQASQSTAGLMNNLEKQSRPLPLLLRFAPQAVQAVMLWIGVLK